MPKSKSKQNARAASSGGLPKHPALTQPDPLLNYRLGSEDSLRLPDAENQPTAATVLRSEYTMGSDANGELVWAVGPALANAKTTWPVAAGVIGALTATAHPQQTAFASEATAARMVACRITVTYIGAELEAAGYLTYSEKHSAAEVTGKNISDVHVGGIKQVRATEGLLAHLDYVQPPRFESTLTTGAFMANTYAFGVFSASGLPASKASLFRVRETRFMEYLPAEGSLAEGETAHEPHSVGTLSVHGALSGPGTSVTSLKDKGSFMSKIMSVANAAYHMVQPLMPYVASQARSQLVGMLSKAAPLMLAM